MENHRVAMQGPISQTHSEKGNHHLMKWSPTYNRIRTVCTAKLAMHNLIGMADIMKRNRTTYATLGMFIVLLIVL